MFYDLLKGNLILENLLVNFTTLQSTVIHTVRQTMDVVKEQVLRMSGCYNFTIISCLTTLPQNIQQLTFFVNTFETPAIFRSNIAS